MIVKAAMGGGGRGMRVVRLARRARGEAFDRARSEAEAAFGDDTVFIERFVERPRHVEVQILADAEGNVVHLFERDCSVQRRHQKVVEMAPAQNLDPPKCAKRLCADAVKIAQAVGYRNAGTVEFLVDRDGRHYFIEANPRIQVEHTVTEEITGVDLVQSQIRIAGGATFADLGFRAGEDRASRGFAIQCRVTTEDPRPRVPAGHRAASRCSAPARAWAFASTAAAATPAREVSPDYDSLLVKVTARGPRPSRSAVQKLHRALAEFRIRGVSTNIPFLQNVLDDTSVSSPANTDTTFVDDTPELFLLPTRRNRAQRLLRFSPTSPSTGRSVPGMSEAHPPSTVEPVVPARSTSNSRPPGVAAAILRSAGPRGVRQGGATAPRAARHRHHLARRAPVAPDDPGADAGLARDRTGHRAVDAAASSASRCGAGPPLTSRYAS